MMQELEKRLKRELQQNMKASILHSAKWSIPVHSLEVEYIPVKRTKMDVLMKMMLLTFQKTEIESTADLSELLLVEPLFIQDLIDLMIRTRLIERREGIYRLTEKGVHQLENGIFEEAQDPETSNVLYSPSHEAFLTGEVNVGDDSMDELEIYRYVKEGYLDEELSFEDEQLIEALRMSGAEAGEGEVQTVISEIVSMTDLYIDDIPCLEFLLYNKDEDIVYARVWNTLLEQWDEKLENQLNDKERLEWRSRYLS